MLGNLCPCTGQLRSERVIGLLKLKNLLFLSKISIHTHTIHFVAREYTFDVRYTSREVHDRARRNLYHAATEASVRSVPSMSGGGEMMTSGTGQLTIVSLPAADTSSSSLNRTTSRTSHTDESMASVEEVSTVHAVKQRNK